MGASATLAATTPGGAWLVLALSLPIIGVLAGFLLGSRRAEMIAFATLAANLAVTLLIACELLTSRAPVVYLMGGWPPPLGVALAADGLSVAMMLTTSVVQIAIALYARADFATPAGSADARRPFVFWTLLVAVGGSITLVVLSRDFFTLYVAIELLTFTAVPLVALDGRAETVKAALRYVIYALAGSLFYLVGCVLVYGAYGTLDMGLVASRLRADPATIAAASLMTAGLFAKTAVFPLHLWLPPAHAGAPPAASALLSALVVKGSYFIVARLWLDAMPGLLTPAVGQVLGAFGALAIVVGSAIAIRQPRLKMMIAYSTVGQIGYLLLFFPLVAVAGAATAAGAAALTGGMLQVASHATAKAAMFMAAGLVVAGRGHDRVADFAGLAREQPWTVAAFALGGIALVGLPPAGGFVAKWLLLSSAIATAQWWWIVVIVVGGLLTATYVFAVLGRALRAPANGDAPVAIVPRSRQAVVLGLAIVSTLLGFVAFAPVDPVQVGRPPLVGAPR